MKTRRLWPASGFVALTLLTGCGGGQEAAPTQIALTVSKSGSTYELTAPETVEAGLAEISLQVDTPDSEQHEAQLVRFEGDHTLAETIDALIALQRADGAATPPWLLAGGGVGSTPGGTTAAVTQVLQPGTYYVVDLEQPLGDDVASFAEQGATATLEVLGDESDAQLPEVDATVTADEFSFETEGLVAGVNRIRFDNSGQERHHILAIPYEPGATLELIKEFATSQGPPDGPPPIDYSRAQVTTVLEGGASQIIDLDMSAGKYAFVCFVANRAGGPPHAALGMINEVEIE